MQVKSDLEMMSDLLIEYKKPETTDARKLAVLEDLEYLVHQVTIWFFVEAIKRLTSRFRSTMLKTSSTWKA